MAAEAAISTLLQLLGEQLIQKVKSLRGVKGKVELLRDELRKMQSFLKDANKKQYEDERVRNWISEIRELAQDAEDTIEMFILNVENARNMSFLNKCTNFGKRMHHLDTIGEEIETIGEKLVSINASRETYGIKDLGEAEESHTRLQVESLRRLSPGKKDEHLVGIEDDVKKVLRESILNAEKKGLSVAFLAGIGGIGKSTLAREIYNRNEVRGKFERRAWVVVSSEFTPQETIKQLILELPGSDKEKLRELEATATNKLYLLQKLKEMLGEQLEGKSYFIVLDDVWETQDLESLITDFPNQQGKASRLLVTTRNKHIAKYDQYVHDMKLLDPKNGWELLLKKVFNGSSDGICSEELETVGSQILEKCHGLPLAINVVGGLLLMEPQTESGWEKVLKHINSYLGRDDRVFSILELSYQNLSPQLKACFLCLSFFKEDSTIPAKRLINIWDAQGLIQKEGSRNIEEIGRGYLNELINRSMLQIQDLIYSDRVKSCRIHDLVREVCLRKAKEEIGLEVCLRKDERGQEGISTELSRIPRHRVVYGNDLEICSSNQNKHIRSLFLLRVQGDYNRLVTTPSNYWKSYQLLKTLELDGVGFIRLPNSFRSLIGLKCLKMQYGDYDSYILELPSWLDHLKNLEVLDIGGGSCVNFPRLVPLKMKRLRYLSACIVRGPKQISSWKNIQFLNSISQKDWLRYCRSNQTSGCHLHELGIRFEERKIERSELTKVKASLEKLQNLAILDLSFGYGSETPGMALAVPNHLAGLTKLKLRGDLTKFPDATMFPPNLSHLTLDHFYLVDDPMPELGKLPKLSFLKLEDRSSLWLKETNNPLRQTMQVLSDGFPCLENLAIVGNWVLMRIVIEEGGMPKLKHLHIRRCRELNTDNLPKHINISR